MNQSCQSIDRHVIHPRHNKQYDELSRFVREEVDRHLEEHQRLEAQHAELTAEWDRLLRVGMCACACG